MELTSALGLRTEMRQLVTFTNEQIAQPTLALERLANFFFDRSPVKVSIGVSLTDRRKNFRIALRFQSDSAESRKFAKRVKLLTAGEVDIKVTGPIRAISGCNGTNHVTRPLAIGASVGHRDGPGGTVGFFARRTSDDAIGLVSNNHVIALGDTGHGNDAILHPSICDGGTPSSNTIGSLVDDPKYPRLFDGGTKMVDCAFARLNEGVDFDPRTLREGKRLQTTGAAVEMKDPVFKIGRSIEFSKGFITAFHFDNVDVAYEEFEETVTFTEVLEVQTATNEPFSDPGDSGSLVYNSEGRPIGLLFAETAAGGKRGLGHHYVIPIPNVLSALGVEIIN
jgi:hypothetical protein